MPSEIRIGNFHAGACAQGREKKLKRGGDGTERLKTAHSWQPNLNTKTLPEPTTTTTKSSEIFKGFSSFLVQNSAFPLLPAPPHLSSSDSRTVFAHRALRRQITHKLKSVMHMQPCPPGSTHFILESVGGFFFSILLSKTHTIKKSVGMWGILTNFSTSSGNERKHRRVGSEVWDIEFWFWIQHLAVSPWISHFTLWA